MMGQYSVIESLRNSSEKDLKSHLFVLETKQCSHCRRKDLTQRGGAGVGEETCALSEHQAAWSPSRSSPKA